MLSGGFSMIINTILSDGYDITLHQYPENSSLHLFKLAGENLSLGYIYNEENDLPLTISYFIDNTFIGTQEIESGNYYYWNIEVILQNKGLYNFRISADNYELHPDELIYKVLYNYIDHPYMTFSLNQYDGYILSGYDVSNTNENVEIPPYAYTDSYGIKELVSISDGVFMNNSSIKSIIIPEFVTHIGSTVFFGCINLAVATILAVIPPVLDSTNAFEGTESIRIYVPAESVDAYKSAPIWSNIAYAIYPII